MMTRTESVYWNAVENRDSAYDGVFVYAVKTTGIYCRPTCASRRAHRENVEFFASAVEAEGAGYRACRRCQPDEEKDAVRALIERVCRRLDDAGDHLPTLTELAAEFHVSPYHLQRTFKRIVGVSPRQYADSHRRERVKAELRADQTITQAVYEAGYGGSSAFYREAGAVLGMTPIRYREGGAAVNVRYTTALCSLGVLLVAAAERGVCAIRLGDSAGAVIDELRAEFPNAVLTTDDADLAEWVAAVIAYVEGERTRLDLPLDIRATAFQRRVWEALRTVPYGEQITYRGLAEKIGEPTASRAVAGACAANPVALAIPCHRVVREGGALSGYRWGVDRKKALLEREAAHVNT